MKMKQSVVGKHKNESLSHSTNNLPELETMNINKRQELHEMDDKELMKVE